MKHRNPHIPTSPQRTSGGFGAQAHALRVALQVLAEPGDSNPSTDQGETMGKPWENHGKTMGKWWFFMVVHGIYPLVMTDIANWKMAHLII